MTNRQFDDLKSSDPYAAGVAAKKLGRARSYGCHFGMRSTYEASVAEFNRGWDEALPVPTAEQVLAYLADYYRGGFSCSAVTPSVEGACAVDCTVNGTDHWTLWMEANGVYGEY